VSDNDAILFNLSRCRHFPSKKRGWDIYCYWNLGPFFAGFKGCELGIADSPFNRDRSCESFANKPGYGIPLDKDGTNMLTNLKENNFTISELEVWEVTFIT